MILWECLIYSNKDYFQSELRTTITFLLVNEDGEPLPFPEKCLGDGLLLVCGVLKIRKKHHLLAQRELQLAGEYNIVHIFSRDGLIADVTDRLEL